MATLAPSFLIRSSSFLQVTRTTKTSRMSSNFNQIRLRTAELGDTERLEKFLITYNGRNVVATIAFIFDLIFFILAGIKDIHKCLDDPRSHH